MKHSHNAPANLYFPPICNSNSKVKKFNSNGAEHKKAGIFYCVCLKSRLIKRVRLSLQINCETVSILYCKVAHQEVAPTFISELQPNKNATAEQQIINHSLTEA
jgi:hypothetical protein